MGNKLISTFLVFLLVFSLIPLTNAEEIELNYDANGNLIQDKNFYYEYNSLNQLTQIRDRNAQGRTISLFSDKNSIEIEGQVATITASSSSVNRFRWSILETNPACYIAYGSTRNAGRGPVVTNPVLIRGAREGTCTVTVRDDTSTNPKTEVVTYALNVRGPIPPVESAPATGRIIAKYTYDYNGNRILKELFDAQGKSKTVYYPDSSFVREVDERTKAINDIVYYYDSGLVAKKENNKLFYYHPDHLGSTSVVTDEQGRIVENNHYLPFGEMLEGEEDRYLYTGQELDPESQLYYYGARYYSPYLAKFTQPDTIIQDIYNPQNLNRYSYVLNNPYKYNDPSGNFAFIPLIIIGVSLAFVAWDAYDFAKDPNPVTGTFLALNFIPGAGIAKDASKGLKAADKIIDAERVADKGGDAKKTFESFKNVDEAFKYYSKDPKFRSSYKEAKGLFKSGQSGEVKVRSLDEGKTITNKMLPNYKPFEFAKGPASKVENMPKGYYSIEVKDPLTGLVPGHVLTGKHASVSHIKILTKEKNKIYLLIDDMTK